MNERDKIFPLVGLLFFIVITYFLVIVPFEIFEEEKQTFEKIQIEKKNLIKVTGNIDRQEKGLISQRDRERKEYIDFYTDIEESCFSNMGEFKLEFGMMLKNNNLNFIAVGREEEVWRNKNIARKKVYIEIFGDERKLLNFFKEVNLTRRQIFFEKNSLFFQGAQEGVYFKGKVSALIFQEDKPDSSEKNENMELFKRTQIKDRKLKGSNRSF